MRGQDKEWEIVKRNWDKKVALNRGKQKHRESKIRKSKKEEIYEKGKKKAHWLKHIPYFIYYL